MTNEKIILRHVAAVALSSFFKHGRNGERFEYVQTLVGDWGSPKAVSDLKLFCVNNQALKDSLRRIVPPELGDLILGNDAWIEGIAGSDSRFARAEIEVCADHRRIQEIIEELVRTRPTGWDRKAGQLERRAKTIAGERALAFLSRKAIIPKYGFPVDVVELDTRPQRRDSMGVSLQRDLSQAIAEYAPGGKVVANKKEWESCGVKTIPGKEFRVTHYSYDSARNFRQWNEIESPSPQLRKYLEPVFGFVTPLFEEPKVPRGRARCLYTTRPFFPGFPGFEVSPPETETLPGVTVTQARPGRLIILCEGRNQKGFYICRVCGRHMTDPQGAHKTPEESECNGTLDQFSLGHELETDLVRIRFSQLADEWDAYSLAYAVLLGAADTMEVPDSDLNVTITGGTAPNEAAIVLYDNVPGSAGLVAQLEDVRVFRRMLVEARERLGGGCGCDSSCYGCLRSYRNQFAHPYLDRNSALDFLDAALSQAVGPISA